MTHAQRRQRYYRLHALFLRAFRSLRQFVLSPGAEGRPSRFAQLQRRFGRVADALDVARRDYLGNLYQ